MERSEKFQIRISSWEEGYELVEKFRELGYKIDDNWLKSKIYSNYSTSGYLIYTDGGIGLYSIDGYYTEKKAEDFFVRKQLTKLPEKWHVVPRNEEQNLFYLQAVGRGYIGLMHNVAFNGTLNKWQDRINISPNSRELSLYEFKTLVLQDQTTKQTNNIENMKTNSEQKKDKITAIINSENQLVIQKNGVTTIQVAIKKETLTTRVIKLQSVKFDRKDKKEEKPIVTIVEREVSVSVLADENGYLYTGYVVKNPKDKEVSVEIGKTIARNRAIHPRTNLTTNGFVSYELVTKQVLKGVADHIFARLSQGSIQLKGVK